jgi:hypothetical protein
MDKMKDSINWFEIPVSDFDRAKAFYSAIYDYEMYDSVINENRMGFLPMDAESEGIGGAICYGDFYKPSADGAVVYLNGGDDLNTILNRVEAGDGKILQPKMKVTVGIGYIAFFEDTEGNRVGLHSRN